MEYYIVSMIGGFVSLLIAVLIWERKLYANAIQVLVIALFFLAIAVKNI